MSKGRVIRKKFKIKESLKYACMSLGKDADTEEKITAGNMFDYRF